jgi:Amt family ammonium transporter
MSWILVEWIRFKKPTAVGFASGAVAGLVAVTPACGWVDATAALLLGLIVSPICLAAISLKGKLNVYDDALDVFGVHACGGMWGAIATGLWANSKINSTITQNPNPVGVSNGILSGLPGASLGQLWAQLGAIAITVVGAVVATLILGMVTKLICGGLRPTAEEEENGLDLADHGETGYGAELGGIPAMAGVD